MPKIRGKDYIVEPCKTCGSPSLVRVEDKDVWNTCRECSGNKRRFKG